MAVGVNRINRLLDFGLSMPWNEDDEMRGPIGTNVPSRALSVLGGPGNALSNDAYFQMFPARDVPGRRDPRWRGPARDGF
jgi:hypothetical protein